MRLKICDNPQQVGYLAAADIALQLNTKKNSTLIQGLELCMERMEALQSLKSLG